MMVWFGGCPAIRVSSPSASRIRPALDRLQHSRVALALSRRADSHCCGRVNMNPIDHQSSLPGKQIAAFFLGMCLSPVAWAITNTSDTPGNNIYLAPLVTLQHAADGHYSTTTAQTTTVSVMSNPTQATLGGSVVFTATVSS